MKVVYSKAAREDLLAIRDYYLHELALPDTAHKILSDIRKRASTLSNSPLLGFSLDDRLRLTLGFRALPAGRYIIVYAIDGDTVRVLRIIDTRLEYVSQILRGLIEND